MNLQAATDAGERIASSGVHGFDAADATVLVLLGEANGHPPELIARFIAKVKSDHPGCWEWTGSKLAKGYGKFAMGRKTAAGNRSPEFAHRASHELFNKPIPPGLVVDHRCNNTSCVNPWHLVAVSQRENILRGKSIAAMYARLPCCVNGHPKTAENTYFYKGKAYGCRICQADRDRLRRDRRGNRNAGL